MSLYKKGHLPEFLKFLKFLLDNSYLIGYNSRVTYLGVAQFGSVLEWGSRGREFKSPHSDQKEKDFTA